MSSPLAAPSNGSTPVPVRRERVFTLPLTGFLVAVTVIVGSGLRSMYPSPDVDGAILLLADGDLDGDERRRMLRITIEGALHSQSVAHRWAGLLAAVVLEDRAAYQALLAPLGTGPVPTVVPAESDRELLHLGDAMLGNLLLAMIAEAAGDRPGALHRWRQVAAQSRLTARSFAAELAAAGVRRQS